MLYQSTLIETDLLTVYICKQVNQENLGEVEHQARWGLLEKMG